MLYKINKYYNTLSLFKKIFLPNVVGIIFLSISVILIYSFTLKVQNNKKNLQNILIPALHLTSENNLLLEEMSNIFLNLKVNNESFLKEEAENKIKLINKNLLKIIKLNKNNKEVIKQGNINLKNFKNYCNIMNKDLNSDNKSFISNNSKMIFESYKETNKNFKLLEFMLNKMNNDEFFLISKNMDNINFYIIVLAIFIFLIYGVSTSFINFDVSNRLKRLLNNISLISNEGFNGDKIEILFEDEFGDIVKNINKAIEKFEVDTKDLSKSLKYFENLSNFDSLTQIYNRRFVDDYLYNKNEEFLKQNKLYGIIMIDVDHFKNFNDTYGHSTGDVVLQKVALTIKEHIRGDDIVGRFGGEEFIIITNNCNKDGIFQMADKIRNLISKINLKNDINVTASLGCSIISTNSSIKELINEADKSLYMAKNNGRNQVVVFDFEK